MKYIEYLINKNCGLKLVHCMGLIFTTVTNIRVEVNSKTVTLLYCIYQSGIMVFLYICQKSL